MPRPFTGRSPRMTGSTRAVSDAIPLERRQEIIVLVGCPECKVKATESCIGTRTRLASYIHTRRVIAGLRHPDFKW